MSLVTECCETVGLSVMNVSIAVCLTLNTDTSGKQSELEVVKDRPNEKNHIHFLSKSWRYLDLNSLPWCCSHHSPLEIFIRQWVSGVKPHVYLWTRDFIIQAIFVIFFIFKFFHVLNIIFFLCFQYRDFLYSRKPWLYNMLYSEIWIIYRRSIFF